VLAAFISKFDSLGLGGLAPSKLKPFMPTPGGVTTAFAERQQNMDDLPIKMEIFRSFCQFSRSQKVYVPCSLPCTFCEVNISIFVVVPVSNRESWLSV